MLSNTAKLYFPKMVFEKPTTIQISSNDPLTNFKSVNLYKLDWSRKENKCNHSLKELNDEYESLISNLRFVISDNYLVEIRRCSWDAVKEWNIRRQIDTSLKSMYMQPAAAYVETAFRLLVDSLFDEETKFYYRKKDKLIMIYLLLYKFWKNQVSNSLIFNFSKINELLTVSINENITDVEAEEINKFLKHMNSDLGNNKNA